MPRKRVPKSNKGLRDFMRDVVPVWNKQCVRCTTVYSKFHRLCPECEYGDWLLEGEVESTEPSDTHPFNKQREHYKPRLETIRSVCRMIQKDWVKDGDVRATQGPMRWTPPGSQMKQRDADHDQF